MGEIFRVNNYFHLDFAQKLPMRQKIRCQKKKKRTFFICFFFFQLTGISCPKIALQSVELQHFNLHYFSSVVLLSLRVLRVQQSVSWVFAFKIVLTG